MKNIVPVPCTWLKEIGSTQTAARGALRAGTLTAPHLWVAERQTAGRGRLGRSFFSPPGGLYMTLALQIPPPDTLRLVTPAAAVAVCRAIADTCGIRCGIKWVNDIEVDGKKICGILTEAAGNHIFIGIGINLWPEQAFPEDLTPRAATLLGAPRENLRQTLAAAICRHLLPLIPPAPTQTVGADLVSARPPGIIPVGGGFPDIPPPFLQEYRARSTLLNQPITVHTPTGQYSATAVEIDDCAALVVQDEHGQIQTLTTGEVSVRLQK